jgi:hypothetical protein
VSRKNPFERMEPVRSTEYLRWVMEEERRTNAGGVRIETRKHKHEASIRIKKRCHHTIITITVKKGGWGVGAAVQKKPPSRRPKNSIRCFDKKNFRRRRKSECGDFQRLEGILLWVDERERKLLRHWDVR